MKCHAGDFLQRQDKPIRSLRERINGGFRNCSLFACEIDRASTMEVLSCAIPPKFCVSVAQVKPSSIATTLVSFIAAVPPSLALNYNDFVTRGENATSGNAVSFDFTSTPAAVALAGVAVAAAAVVPLIAFRKQSFGSAPPSAAFTALEEESAVLLDIRAPQDVKATGSPNLKSLRKKPLQVAYRPDDESFVSKVLSKCREPESSTLYILDDGLEGNKNAMAVAKLLAKSGFAKALAITGGAEAWQESELPWLEPWKGLNLNLDGLKSLLSGTSENPNLVPTTLGAAAAAGLGVAVFTEAETVLQLLGSAAFIQIFARKFMFADDREKTMKEIQTFLDTKVAPKEFADELKEVGRVLLPREGESEKKSKVETMTPAVADQQVN